MWWDERQRHQAAGSIRAASQSGADALLTFGVAALQQARLPDLHVEGFVLLVLLVVDYFHPDGFTEEGRRKRRKRKQGEEREGERKKTAEG